VHSNKQVNNFSALLYVLVLIKRNNLKLYTKKKKQIIDYIKRDEHDEWHDTNYCTWQNTDTTSKLGISTIKLTNSKIREPLQFQEIKHRYILQQTKCKNYSLGNIWLSAKIIEVVEWILD